MTTLIYKIAPAPLWREAESVGQFSGSPVDRADGFIHFSSAEQVSETVTKHFAGQSDLLLVAVEAEALGPDLRWEVSRGGALFPHLYTPLRLDAVRWIEALPLDANGTHRIPALQDRP